MKKSHKKLEVVLLANVEKLGERGDKVEVAKGYAVNFLIPQKMAVIFSHPQAIALLNEIKKEKEKKQVKIEKVKEIAEKIKNLKIKITTKTAKGEKIFGSITKKEILKEIEKSAKVKIEKAEIVSPKMPIKKIGNYKIKIKLASGIEAEVDIRIRGENNKKKGAK